MVTFAMRVRRDSSKPLEHDAEALLHLMDAARRTGLLKQHGAAVDLL